MDRKTTPVTVKMCGKRIAKRRCDVTLQDGICDCVSDTTTSIPVVYGRRGKEKEVQKHLQAESQQHKV